VSSFFANFENLQNQLTQELAIQSEENPQFVFHIQHKSAARDIPVVFSFRSNGSFRQFKEMVLSGKLASMTRMTNNRSSIRI
jgi:hypothetical protein